MFEYEEYDELPPTDPEDSNQRIIGVIFSIVAHLLIMVFLYRKQESLQESMKAEAALKNCK